MAMIARVGSLYVGLRFESNKFVTLVMDCLYKQTNERTVNTTIYLH